MSPTPTPEIPVPGESGTLSDYLGSNGMSPSLDEVLTDLAEHADPNAPYGQNLDAALASVSRPIFGVDYIPSNGLIITMSPWVILVTLAAALVVGGVIVARRLAHRSDAPSRARFIERERIERERLAAAKVAAAKAEGR
ncbi:hypothetical protein [Mycobacteroides abscessus]|uniref:hypothetical protein n=1 Tax=Mycobacteroides abscessus TaxID=36809 RepID=UPI000C260C8E|nr:hypothetical protein [Mycobacteroides abscessus]